MGSLEHTLVLGRGAGRSAEKDSQMRYLVTRIFGVVLIIVLIAGFIYVAYRWGSSFLQSRLALMLMFPLFFPAGLPPDARQIISRVGRCYGPLRAIALPVF